MHRPMVVCAMFACCSICHHLHSLHKPQSDAAIVVSLLKGQISLNAPMWFTSDASIRSTRFCGSGINIFLVQS
jgi:hypothetical protein